MALSDLILSPTNLGVCLGIVFSSFLYFSIIQPLFFSSLSHIPGPTLCKLSWYYISYFDLLLQRNNKVQEWHEKYGPIICIRPGEVSFSSASFMRNIYGTSGKYAKSKYFDNFIAYGERAVFAVRPYGVHRHKRAMISSFYQSTNIYKPVNEEFIRERVHALLKRIENAMIHSPSLDIYQMVTCYAFDNITRLLYGHRHCTYSIETDGKERQILAGLKKIQLWGPARYTFPLLYELASTCLSSLNIPRSSLNAEHNLASWNYERFTESANDLELDKDDTLLRRLLNVKDTDGNPLSQNYIAAELLDNLNGGQETAAVALTYIIYHLSRNPDWQAKLHDELHELKRQSDGFPSFASVDAAPILDACIREAYRINPGSSGHAERIIPEGGKDFAGVFIPEGTVVSASTLALHHNATIFPSPSTFAPQRWLVSSNTAAQLRALESSFIPFGYGGRLCLGKALATMEIKLLVAALYLRFSTEVDWAKTTEEGMKQAGTQDAVPRGLRCDILVRRLID